MFENLSEKEKETIKLVKKNRELEPYFFAKLIEKKDIKWFSVLKDYNFFDCSNMPIISEKNYYAEEWNILNYVKNIIDQLLNNKENFEYILNKFLLIAEKSSNYRIIEQTISILINIPTEYYFDNYLSSLVNNWFLKCTYGIEHILYVVVKDLLPYIAERDSDKAINIFTKSLTNFYFSIYF